MNKFEEGQRRARDIARERHRNQLRFWKGLTLAAIIWGAGCLALTIAFVLPLRKPWRTDDPPAMTKLGVTTYGFFDKKGAWRSYETGEPITVVQWHN